MESKALARHMRELKHECEKLAEAHEILAQEKCAQILLAAAGLSMLREKVAREAQGD